MPATAAGRPRIFPRSISFRAPTISTCPPTGRSTPSIPPPSPNCANAAFRASPPRPKTPPTTSPSLAARHPFALVWIVHRDPPLFISESCPHAAQLGRCPGPKNCDFTEQSMTSKAGEAVKTVNRNCRFYTLLEKPIQLAGPARTAPDSARRFPLSRLGPRRPPPRAPVAAPLLSARDAFLLSPCQAPPKASSCSQSSGMARCRP